MKIKPTFKQMKKKKAGWEKRLRSSQVITPKMDMKRRMEVYPIGFVKQFIRNLLAQELRGLRMVKNTTFGFISPYREGYNEAVGVNNKAINQRLKEVE